MDDEEMPINQYGEKADICLNPLGVFNRLNISQLYEQEINFISNNIIRKMKDKELSEKEEIFFEYMSLINEKQYESLVDYYNNLNLEEANEFFESIDKNGIYIHQPPFYDNISFNQLADIYKHYPEIKPYKFTVNNKELEQEMIM